MPGDPYAGGSSARSLRPCPGAILAGGANSRYGGFPKGRLRTPDCRSILARLTAEIRKAGVCDLAIVASGPEAYREEDLPTIVDLRRGMGPLAGVESALNHFREAVGVLLLPCDLPGLTWVEIARLLRAFDESGKRLVAARTGGDCWHPLCAVVPTGLRPAVERALDRNHLSVRRLFEELGVVPVDFDPGPAFANINSPDDWGSFQQRSEGRIVPEGDRRLQPTESSEGKPACRTANRRQRAGPAASAARGHSAAAANRPKSSASVVCRQPSRGSVR